MDEKEAALYLNTEYSEHFKKLVTYHTVKRWLGKGRIVELSELELDKAVQQNRIPPKRGRPARFTQANKDDIIEACKTMTRGAVARMFKCDESYVSLVVRGLR